ncbi:hypothetical protein [Hamadaea tsunoensis]|uniref:hypothetical protein n=1 Tax=Hamadaea tsunoensis TaxID=53368 RepID=UPI00040277E1|nr:hypothetical protein [Hamadaea tsunoensis]
MPPHSSDDALVRDLAAQLAAAEARLDELTREHAALSARVSPAGPDTVDRRAEDHGLSRRRLMHTVGKAAAVAGAAAVAVTAFDAAPALATDDQPLLVGVTNTTASERTTSLQRAAGTAGDTPVLEVSTADTAQALRLRSAGTALDVQGGTLGAHVTGTGVGLEVSGGQAPLHLVPHNTEGPPTTGTHQVGELVVDNRGLLFACTGAGTPGEWRQIMFGGGAYWPGVADIAYTTSTVLLDTPYRRWDSRTGQQPYNWGGTYPYWGKLKAGSWIELDVAQAAPNVVPPGARGIVTTVTVTDTVGSGWGAVVPLDRDGVPGTSTVNWTGSGQTIATTTMVFGRGVRFYAANGTHLIVDILGYLV